HRCPAAARSNYSQTDAVIGPHDPGIREGGRRGRCDRLASSHHWIDPPISSRRNTFQRAKQARISIFGSPLISDAANAKCAHREGNRLFYNVDSGSYHFTVASR
ncbi:MAG: hypothetical protein ABSC05_20755, partial [Candidatus Solibacter sp.]